MLFRSYHPDRQGTRASPPKPDKTNPTFRVSGADVFGQLRFVLVATREQSCTTHSIPNSPEEKLNGAFVRVQRAVLALTQTPTRLKGRMR